MSGFLGAMWLLEAASLLPETAPMALGAKELVGPNGRPFKVDQKACMSAIDVSD